MSLLCVALSLSSRRWSRGPRNHKGTLYYTPYLDLAVATCNSGPAATAVTADPL